MTLTRSARMSTPRKPLAPIGAKKLARLVKAGVTNPMSSFSPKLANKPLTPSERNARAALNWAAMSIAISAARGRGWIGCGDLVTPALRSSPYFKRLTDEQRFAFGYVTSESGCWPWVASTKDNGYGQIRFRKHNCNAHRISYELFVGSVPDGLDLDHTCLNKACVNPKHLEAVTGGENTRRWAETITTCPQGHADRFRRVNGRTVCRTCHNGRTSVRNARNQVAVEQELGRRAVRLTDDDLALMRSMRASGERVKDIAGEFGVTPKYASAVMAGSRSRTRRHTGPSTATLLLLDIRSDGSCEFPGCASAAAQTHHRRPRRMGGTREPLVNLAANLVRLCGDHHAWIESNRTAALSMGLLLHQNANPIAVPVALRHAVDSVWLDNVGGFERIGRVAA